MRKGENYEMEPERLAAANIHVVLEATGRVQIIKQRISLGESKTLYRSTGEPTALVIPPKKDDNVPMV